MRDEFGVTKKRVDVEMVISTKTVENSRKK